MAQGITGVLKSVGNVSRQKIVQGTSDHSAGDRVERVFESQSSPEVLIEGMLNTRAAVLKAKLHVMLVQLPGKIVDQLVVRVHAGTRIARSRTQLSYAANEDDRQSVIRKSATGVEPDRAGMKSLILRKKSFYKPVPAVTQFVDLVGTDGAHIRKRNELHPRRRCSVKSRKLSTASRQGEGK